MNQIQLKQLEDFQARHQLKFNDPNLLRTVFVHRSYLNESPEDIREHNERLEFLGDAVLELVVTEYLYKTYDNPEGELTNWRSSIVKGEVLAKVASDIELGQQLYLSKGEEKSGGRSRSLILANTFEALIGAIYLDLGYEASSKFIHKYLIALLPEIIEKKLYIDPKSRLQEVCQDDLGATPEYRVLSEEGPDHQKQFVVGVHASGRLIAKGTGTSKQRAEQDAASIALTTWPKNKRS
ncbi:MAG: ribonuclease III [Candidatus Berkelbacteria bacterium]|nr:MAG: ribonuclease III [Candidatus Berkelbacteria bacterium]QQG52131.1 MAG: ribonuclease III [Candidatus Berkelbacteria bacterium]